MTTLKTTWGTHDVTLTWVPANEAPSGYAVTSTHGFCFYKDEVLMVNLDTRGWDFPGGHMEAGETPLECFAREAMEEAYVSGKAEMLGYVLVDNREDATFDPSKYPEIGCQIYYRMDIDTVHTFDRDFESSERETFTVSEVGDLHNNWNGIYQEILNAAVARGEVG